MAIFDLIGENPELSTGCTVIALQPFQVKCMDGPAAVLALARDWVVPFLLGQRFSSAAPCPDCRVTCQSCPAVACGSLTCSGTSTTEQAVTSYGTWASVAITFFLLGFAAAVLAIRYSSWAGSPRVAEAPADPRALPALPATPPTETVLESTVVAATPSSLRRLGKAS